MSRALSILLALAAVLGMALPVAANEPEPATTPTTPEIVPGEVIVQFRQGNGPDVARARGLAVVAELGAPGKGLPTLVSTGGRPVEQVIAELEADPAVAQVEPNYVVHLANEGSVAAIGVNDPLTGDQYSLDRMRVRDAWALSKGASNVIAVLDTGVQFDHPDLAGRLLTGRDFVNGDDDATDDNAHGTWVSGIIAANANDGYGMAGISWSDKILPVKIMNREGSGTTADLIAGIRWSADQGARIINMSVGGFKYSGLVQDAVNYAFNKGAVLVAAAGNNGIEETFFPASFDNVISVSATQVDDEFSHWSSYGSKVDVSAPGASVLVPNCYVCTYADRHTWGTHTYISGTSFATPNVAGVVALLRARYPSWSPAQITARLFSTVDDLGYSGWDNRYGRGRVNAYRALGASVTASGTTAGDGLESNNTLGSARVISLGATTRPSLHPAGDVDVFAVDVPRAGRLDVRVTGVEDTRTYPWNRSSLPIDPIVELYNSSGSLLRRVDSQPAAGTELASVSVGGPTRILVRVSNYLPNGNRAAYSITPTYVDTVAPVATIAHPVTGATSVSRFVSASVLFSEPVLGVTSSTLRLREVESGKLVSASVVYDAARREGRLAPVARLDATREYRIEATAGITDTAGNRLTAKNSSFTTGTASFSDTVGNPFEGEIEWLAGAGLTNGCTAERFCPKSAVTREQMASFLARAMKLPATSRDYFVDDARSGHEDNINRIAAAGLTKGCAPGRFCPTGTVTREQMASFLARALNLPYTSRDYFTDDERSAHEADINRVAAAGITSGCGGDSYCPRAAVTREQMAAFIYRAFSGRH